MNNTAISANKEKLIFKNGSHRKFYKEWLPKCRYQDVYHKALAYCLGINQGYQKSYQRNMPFQERIMQTVFATRMEHKWFCESDELICIVTEGKVWMITRNMKQMMESRQYSVEKLFCSGYTRFFLGGN